MSEIFWKERKDYIGLSSEEKPTNQINGSTFYEVDTSDFYMYYEGTWYKQGEENETTNTLNNETSEVV